MHITYADNELKQIKSEFEVSSPLINSNQQGSDSNWKKIRQEVTCVICLKLFTDPKSMPCLHTYCKKCLMGVVTKQSHDPDLPRDTPAINCPLCRAEVALCDKGIEGLPTNFSAARIVETVQLQDKLEENKKQLCNSCCKESNDAVASCYDCGQFFLCEHCVKVHRNIPVTKNHDLMKLKDILIPTTSFPSIKNSPLCQKHPGEPLKLYCQNCEVLVCRDCVLVQHKRHNFSFVDDLIIEQKQQLKDTTLQQLYKILTSTKEAITGVEQMQAKVDSWKDQHVAQLNKTFQKITEKLNNRKEFLLDKINQITEETSSPLEKQKGDLTTLKGNIEKCHDFTRNTLQNGTNSEIMSARKQMLQRTEHLIKHHGSSQLPPVTKPTKTVFYCLDKITTEIEQVSNFVDLQQCCIESSAYEKETLTLKVILKDTVDQPICNAADTFTATIATSNITPSVEELGNGKYSASFTPVACGDCIISIQINGLHISNSPKTMWCRNTDDATAYNESCDEEDSEFKPCVEELSQSPPKSQTPSTPPTPVEKWVDLTATYGNSKVENFSDDDSDRFYHSKKTESTKFKKKKEKKSKKNMSK